VRVTVVTVGRPRHEALARAIADYEARAAHYWTFAVKEVREERGSERTVVRRREGERLAAALEGRSYVACAQAGRALDSEGFARWLGEARDSGRDVNLVIGGAFGLDEAVSAGAAGTLALAPWTLPHELARLVLVEQLYRAGTILRGEPYHK
jgi:23S rRNA (pseudouridine1915-N3)-methyltransferase